MCSFFFLWRNKSIPHILVYLWMMTGTNNSLIFLSYIEIIGTNVNYNNRSKLKYWGQLCDSEIIPSESKGRACASSAPTIRYSLLDSPKFYELLEGPHYHLKYCDLPKVIVSYWQCDYTGILVLWFPCWCSGVVYERFPMESTHMPALLMLFSWHNNSYYLLNLYYVCVAWRS